jgi:hypothetical protein
MGIFGRRKDGWHPNSGAPTDHSAETMSIWFADWEGCAGDQVTRVGFNRNDDADGWLTVWVFPGTGPVHGTYVLQFAYEYRIEDGTGEPWTYTGYEDDPDEGWDSMSLVATQETAKDVALGLMDAEERQLACFGWDGRPF